MIASPIQPFANRLGVINAIPRFHVNAVNQDDEVLVVTQGGRYGRLHYFNCARPIAFRAAHVVLNHILVCDNSLLKKIINVMQVQPCARLGNRVAVAVSNGQHQLASAIGDGTVKQKMLVAGIGKIARRDRERLAG